MREESVGEWGKRLPGGLELVGGPQASPGSPASFTGDSAPAVCAMLGAARSLYTFALWDREHPRIAHSLGFRFPFSLAAGVIAKRQHCDSTRITLQFS